MNAIERRIQDLYNAEPDLTLDASTIDRFWDDRLALFREKPLSAKIERVDTPLRGIDVYDVTYEGFDDTPVHGWYLVPSYLGLSVYPCVVFYHGYTGDRGLPERHASWLLAGFAVFAVDVRGQGGDTGNRLEKDHGVTKGWMTQNITDKERCYYMAITMDAVKAVDWVLTRPEINLRKVAVVGPSQGGGLALIVAALHGGVSVCVADVPNMCHMDFGILNSTGSLVEAAEFVKRYPDMLEPVLHTLAHFDIKNLAHRIHIPVRMSVGLKDMICMPETVFAAYNRLHTTKHLEVRPFAGHEVSARLSNRHLQYLSEWAAD